ncbi:MAG: hypothetical protein ACE5JM_04340 [Armatimonadota bacterium]
MPPIIIRPSQGQMNCSMQWPLLPGEIFRLNIPEAIVNNDGGRWGVQEIKPRWQAGPDGQQSYDVEMAGGMRLQVRMVPFEDHVDINYEVTNLQKTPWTESLAFTCFNHGSVPSINDFELLRTYIWRKGKAYRLVDIERQFSTRPLVQLFGIEGARPWPEVDFVARFRASPREPCEPLIAIQSRDGRLVTGVAARPALFLFHNAEYSCIHSCPTFGPLKPNETGKALTRHYFLQGTIEDLRKRYDRDFPE